MLSENHMPLQGNTGVYCGRGNKPGHKLRSKKGLGEWWFGRGRWIKLRGSLQNRMVLLLDQSLREKICLPEGVIWKDPYSGGRLHVGCKLRMPNVCCWVVEQRASDGDQTGFCVILVLFPTCDPGQVASAILASNLSWVTWMILL